MPDTPTPRTVRFTHATAQMVRRGPHVAASGPSAFPAGPTLAKAAIQGAAPRALLRKGLLGWMGAHKAMVAVASTLVVTASVAVALVTISQPLVATPTAGSSPVVFGSGDDVTSLDALNLVDAPTITTGGGSATVTVYGIPGASALSLGEILELTNTDTSDNAEFTVSLSVAGTPAASLTAFTLTFVDDVSGTPTTRTWNLLTTPTLTTYTLSDAEVWEFTVSSLTMTSAATGSQGALTITATITQV